MGSEMCIRDRKRSAPKDVFDALAKRAIMNHFMTFDVSKEKLIGTTWRVCAKSGLDDESDPRWDPQKKFWKTIPLECDNEPEGVTVYETFIISKQ